MARLTNEAWHKFRILWENDPLMSFGDIAVMAKITPQAVGQRAKKDEWKKVVTQAQLAREARTKADERMQEKPPLPLPPSVDAPDSETVLANALTGDAVDQRAQIVQRHREEWNYARVRVYSSLKSSDGEGLKRAKMAAESFKLIQEGERRAWGLDLKDDPIPNIIRG